MDAKVRAGLRVGDLGPWFRALEWAPPGPVHGPASLLEATCARCGKIGIDWSDCSYCEDCHHIVCPVYRDGPRRETSYVLSGTLQENLSRSCNYGFRDPG